MEVARGGKKGPEGGEAAFRMMRVDTQWQDESQSPGCVHVSDRLSIMWADPRISPLTLATLRLLPHLFRVQHSSQRSQLWGGVSALGR